MFFESDKISIEFSSETMKYFKNQTNFIYWKKCSQIHFKRIKLIGEFKEDNIQILDFMNSLEHLEIGKEGLIIQISNN